LQKNGTGVETLISEKFFEALSTGVLGYVGFIVKNLDTAEAISLNVLKKSLARLSNNHDGTGCTETIQNWTYKLARNSIKEYFAVNSLNHQDEDYLKSNAYRLLSEMERDVLSLKLGSGLENHEIALITGVPEAKISREICDALRKLQD